MFNRALREGSNHYNVFEIKLLYFFKKNNAAGNSNTKVKLKSAVVKIVLKAIIISHKTIQRCHKETVTPKNKQGNTKV